MAREAGAREGGLTNTTLFSSKILKTTTGKTKI